MTENSLGTSLKSLIDQAKYSSISIVKEDPSNQIACESQYRLIYNLQS